MDMDRNKNNVVIVNGNGDYKCEEGKNCFRGQKKNVLCDFVSCFSQKYENIKTYCHVETVAEILSNFWINL